MRGWGIGLTTVLLLSACARMPTAPQTLGEAASGYTYVPLDGLTVDQALKWNEWVEVVDDAPNACKPGARLQDLLVSLPDISVRFAVQETSAKGDVGFGPVKLTAQGSSYKAVLDYVNVDAVPVTFYVRKIVQTGDGAHIPMSIDKVTESDETVVSYEAEILPDKSADPSTYSDVVNKVTKREEKFEKVTIPVYVGIGLRVIADILAMNDGVQIASLGGIGGSAEAGLLSGGLTVQTIGINGAVIAGAIPTPSRLDQTTVENALLAIGSSRTALYANRSDTRQVALTPRVVGLYSPIGSHPALINALYSELARVPPKWRRSCVADASAAPAPTQAGPQTTRIDVSPIPAPPAAAPAPAANTDPAKTTAGSM